jgi:hypothetical protein
VATGPCQYSGTTARGRGAGLDKWLVCCLFALLGYYPERLAFTLLPLVLCLVAALLPY